MGLAAAEYSDRFKPYLGLAGLPVEIVRDARAALWASKRDRVFAANAHVRAAFVAYIPIRAGVVPIQNQLFSVGTVSLSFILSPRLDLARLRVAVRFQKENIGARLSASGHPTPSLSLICSRPPIVGI
eukprot:2766143-Rhodomonas_salina.3